MEDFPTKNEQLHVILSKSTDEVLLTRALIIIHNDIITHTKQAAKVYCAKGLMEGLVSLSRSSNNLLVIILSTSMIYSLCCYEDSYKEKFFQLKGAVHLLAMISARDNTDKGEDMMNRTLLMHEQAAKLLILLTNSTKYQQQLVSLGFLEKLVDLCSIFNRGGSHTNCCFSKLSFDDEARELTKGLIEGRKLVGKIDPHQSGGSKKGTLNVLAVDLFDTTTDIDININKQLLKLGVAWPDSWPVVSLEESKKRSAVTESEDEENVWSDFYVTKVVDAHCFWAFIDSEAPSKISRMSCLLEEYIYSSDVCPLDEIRCGSRVCLSVLEGKWLRGCVLENDESTNHILVLLVDYGYVVKVDCGQLFPLPDVVKEIPHQASLCVLKGVRAAPAKPVILEYATELICNMSQSGHTARMELHHLGGTEALLKLCQLPNENIALRAAAGISNLSLNFNIRAQIGFLGGCKIILDLLKRYIDNNALLEVLLGCFINLVIECIGNRKIVATENGLLILMKIYRSSKTQLTNRELVLKAVKNLVGNGWYLLDPVNVPDVRGIIEEQIDTMKGCFNLPNLCGEEILEEVRKRRRRRALKPHEAHPTPTYVSLTIDDLVKKLKETESSDNDYDTKSEGYKTGPDTDGDDSLGIEKRLPMKEYEGYLYRRSINVEEDERHCFMYEHSIRQIKAVDIGYTVCAFLNTGQGGTIYIGVAKTSQAYGINISRKERDNLRLGVDDLLERFHPRVKHDKYEIKFVPVMKGTSLADLEQYEERYVIEVHIGQNSHKLYQTPSKKMFFRDHNKNSELNMQQIREKTIREQEEKYQSEIRALRLTLNDARNQLKLRNSDP